MTDANETPVSAGGRYLTAAEPVRAQSGGGGDRSLNPVLGPPPRAVGGTRRPEALCAPRGSRRCPSDWFIGAQAAVTLLMVAIASCSGGGGAPAGPGPMEPPPAPSPPVALANCEPGAPAWMDLPVCAEGSRDGYERADFGTGYASLEAQIIDSLPMLGAQVYTPYTCTLYALRQDRSAATDIDHIVALVEAYESGLSRDRFEEFGADILNLTVAVPTVNRNQKSANDAGEWRPERNQGWYAATVVAVKQKYGMSVDPAERDALEELLAADPGRRVTCGG